MNDFNVHQDKWDEIRKATARPIWAAQMKTWQGGQFSKVAGSLAVQKFTAPVWSAQMKGTAFSKAAESIVAMQKAAAQQVWSAQMKGTAFSKMTEALAFQKLTASVYNENLFKGLPDFQFERAVEIAFHVLDTATDPSGMAAAGDPTSVAVDDPAHKPLMPGLVDPWQQIRHWNLATWIAFVGVVAAIVSILVTVGQARPQEGIEPEDIEKIIRIMQQSSPTTGTLGATTNPPPSSTTSTVVDREQIAPAGCRPRGEGEVGSPVTDASSPGRRAAGGRPQGRP